MNCLRNLYRSSAFPFQTFRCNQRKLSSSANSLEVINSSNLNRSVTVKEGSYEYKYIVDGKWTCNKDEHVTSPNKDGHVNNLIQVLEDPGSVRASLRKRLTGDDPDLTKEERLTIRRFLEDCPHDEE